MLEIHPSAVVHPDAVIGDDCEIGPYCVVGGNVALGQGNRLHSHVVIDGHTEIGSGNEFFPFAAIGLKTQDLKWQGGTTWTRIGDRNTFRENATVHSATSDGEATVLGSVELSLPAAVYGVLMFFIAFGFGFLIRGRQDAPDRAGTEAAAASTSGERA